MLKPDFITFTGADDLNHVDQLQQFAKDRKVEFAILFSESREGTRRYPERDKIEEFRSAAAPLGGTLDLAAHLCGAWAREVIELGASEADRILSGFSRVQINVGALKQPDHQIGLVHRWARRLEDRFGHSVQPILQCRDAFPEDTRVAWLYDCSGGRGTIPDSWPAPPHDGDVEIGYAGGMGPDNVAEILETIGASGRGWIDMESRVRNAHDQFDLDLCTLVYDRAGMVDLKTSMPTT